MRMQQESFTFVKVTFSSRAADHQGAHAHEARPPAAGSSDQPIKPRPKSNQQILLKNEKGLNGTNRAGLICDREIPIIEIPVDRVLDQFIVAVILAFACE